MADPTFVDFYELLMVGQSAQAAEINANYKTISKILHPDQAGPSIKSGATLRMQQLNEARETLLNNTKRCTYDVHLRTHKAQQRRRNEASSFDAATERTKIRNEVRSELDKMKSDAFASIASQNKAVSEAMSKLSRDLDAYDASRRRHDSEKAALDRDKKSLEQSRSSFYAQQSALRKEQHELKADRLAFKKEKDKLKDEQDALRQQEMLLDSRTAQIEGKEAKVEAKERALRTRDFESKAREINSSVKQAELQNLAQSRAAAAANQQIMLAELQTQYGSANTFLAQQFAKVQEQSVAMEHAVNQVLRQVKEFKYAAAPPVPETPLSVPSTADIPMVEVEPYPAPPTMLEFMARESSLLAKRAATLTADMLYTPADMHTRKRVRQGVFGMRDQADLSDASDVETGEDTDTTAKPDSFDDNQDPKEPETSAHFDSDASSEL